MLTLLATLALASPVPCGERARGEADRPRHYVFFRRDHERIADTAFLTHPRIAGAQLTFTWRQLEPERDRYHFDEVRSHLARLRRHGKQLFIQLQDVSFGEQVLVPEYLRTDTSFHGGVAPKYERLRDGRAAFGGWVARRWDPAVRTRYVRLIEALAREFDGEIEGLVLPETSVGFDDPDRVPAGFTPDAYAAALRATLTDARAAFQRSCVVLYANFMPGETLPDRDRGYLRGLHALAAEIGAGVGGPDILPFRPFQWANSLRLIERRPAGALAAIAVQDGNLADVDRATGRRITVAELYRVATERLRLDYIFWGTEEPYFSSEVLPFLRTLGPR